MDLKAGLKVVKRYLSGLGQPARRLVCQLLCLITTALLTSNIQAEIEFIQPSAGLDRPRITIETSLGDIEIELVPARAPLTVRNFLQYADRNYYDGTIFHRVIQGFMIQAGGYDKSLNAFEPGQPVKNESVGGLLNLKGSVAMARTNDPDSATAQFYINLKDNRTMDAKYDNPGYTVFGQVVSGMDVVEKIASTKVENINYLFTHKPLDVIEIRSIRRSSSL